MKKPWLSMFGIGLSMVLMGAGCCASAGMDQGPLPALPSWTEAEDSSRQLGVIWSQQDVGLWVNGEGKVTAVPDVAVLRLGVEAQRQSVAEAHREAAEAMDGAEEQMNGKEFPVNSIEVMEKARISSCSAYDCEYVALAEFFRCKLVTNDTGIIRYFPQTAIRPEMFAG